MSPDNFVDNGSGLGYNKAQNDLYAAVIDRDYLKTHIVKMDEQKPINDTSCQHENLVADTDDRIGDAVYHGCANPKCGVGYYVKI
jgi:hypothetical protein